MKVFISWSGARSRAVAELLHDWIKCVLQATQPWMSSRDIDRGSLWFTEINDQLKDTSVGIICLTKENMNKPWILFEAGALAKGLSSARVCTLLVGLKTSDLDDPLAQFNHTIPDREGMRSLVGTLNGCLGASALQLSILDQVFLTYWEQFETKLEKTVKATPPAKEPESRSEKELLEEILDGTRSLQRRVRMLEASKERPTPLLPSLAGLVTDGLRPDISSAAMMFRDLGFSPQKMEAELRSLGYADDEIAGFFVKPPPDLSWKRYWERVASLASESSK